MNGRNKPEGGTVTITALTGISQLVTNVPGVEHAAAGHYAPLGVITDAALVFDENGVLWHGPSSALPEGYADVVVDVGGRAVMPGFVDSHAHLAFGGDRAEEFAARMAGESYSAGGIRSTVTNTRAASDEQLAANVRRLRDEALAQGTTTLESKSGYGLTVMDERRSLEAIGRFTPESTFLGAHVVPAEYAGRADDYVDLVAGEMLDACAPHAKWIDVFCDRGAFDVDQTRRILTAGVAAGLVPRIHAGQLEPGGGIQLAVELGAASADHVTYASDDDIAALASSSTVATLLPGAEFSTRARYPDARRFLDAGVTVALAADCNPGSSYTTSIPFCIAVAVRDMFMTPGEAVWAATAGGAAALRRTDVGSLRVGAAPDLLVLDAPSYLHLAYRPGVPLVQSVWSGGAVVSGHA
jgi:imidazolonepropionase